MNIHILGIAGTKTAPLAVILKKDGHRISGSDQNQIYPPISTLLAKNKISVNRKTVTKNTDLVIVGNSYRSFIRCQRDYQKALDLHLPIISYTDYLVEKLIKPESILVAGSYGKTTITGLLSFIFLKLKLEPSYMFGGQTVNRIDSTRFGNSNYSIVEACESINGLDTRSTFLYYPVKYVILTSADWEHKDSFKTAKENEAAFIKLIKKIPPNGFVVYNPQSKSAAAVVRHCQSPKIPYNFALDIKPIIPGRFNFENSIAAATLCQQLGLNMPLVAKAIHQFQGIKRRLELISQANNISIYDDFSQSPVRIVRSLQALSKHFPKRPIKVFFEPHASFLQYRNGLKGLPKSLQTAQEIVISPLKFSSLVPKAQRVTIKNYQKLLSSKMKYIPDYQSIYDYYRQTLKAGDILVHFSSGGLKGLECLKQIAKSTIPN